MPGARCRIDPGVPVAEEGTRSWLPGEDAASSDADNGDADGSGLQRVQSRLLLPSVKPISTIAHDPQKLQTRKPSSRRSSLLLLQELQQKYDINTINQKDQLHAHWLTQEFHCDKHLEAEYRSLLLEGIRIRAGCVVVVYACLMVGYLCLVHGLDWGAKSSEAREVAMVQTVVLGAALVPALTQMIYIQAVNKHHLKLLTGVFWAVLLSFPAMLASFTQLHLALEGTSTCSSLPEHMSNLSSVFLLVLALVIFWVRLLHKYVLVMCSAVVALFVVLALMQTPVLPLGQILKMAFSLVLFCVLFLTWDREREQNHRIDFLLRRDLEEDLRQTKQGHAGLKRTIVQIGQQTARAKVNESAGFHIHSPMERALMMLNQLMHQAQSRKSQEEAVALKEVHDLLQATGKNTGWQGLHNHWKVDWETELAKLEGKVDMDTRQWLTSVLTVDGLLDDTANSAVQRTRSLFDMSAQEDEPPLLQSLDEEAHTVVQTAMEQCSSNWEVNLLQVDALTSGNALALIGMTLFERHDLVNQWKINSIKLRNFLIEIQTNYGDNPYHNRVHGIDVLYTMQLLLSDWRLVEKINGLELLAAFIAAICHDYNHPGTNNANEIKVASKLAICYSDQSVLEHHHLAAAFSVLSQKDCNFLKHLPSEDYRILRRTVIGMVLATDLSNHFEYVSRLKALPQQNCKQHLEQDVPLLLNLATVTMMRRSRTRTRRREEQEDEGCG